MSPFSLFACCPECGAVVGEPHWPGCGVRAEGPPAVQADGELVLGRDQALAECRRRGWAVAYVPGEGFRPCRPEEPGAYADLDRYAFWRSHGDAEVVGADGDEHDDRERR